MRQSTFPLRLASSLEEEARKTAKSEGISLNQLINLAVAERYPLCVRKNFRERGARASTSKARKILKRAGKEPPREGDEILANEGRNNGPASQRMVWSAGCDAGALVSDSAETAMVGSRNKTPSRSQK